MNNPENQEFVVMELRQATVDDAEAIYDIFKACNSCCDAPGLSGLAGTLHDVGWTALCEFISVDDATQLVSVLKRKNVYEMLRVIEEALKVGAYYEPR